MNRRNFLFGTLGGGLSLPAMASSIKTTPPIKTKPSPTKIIQPPYDFSCVVGDYEINENLHRYARETWQKMFYKDRYQTNSGAFTKNPIVTMGGEHGPVICDIKNVVGVVTKYCLTVKPNGVGPIRTLVCVNIRIMRTPQGKIFLESYKDGIPWFVTPVGSGFIDIDDNIQSYNFSHFSIADNSAFRCATPLVYRGWDGISAKAYKIESYQNYDEILD